MHFSILVCNRSQGLWGKGLAKEEHLPRSWLQPAPPAAIGKYGATLFAAIELPEIGEQVLMSADG
jgi:hypothetical protein